MIGLDAIAAALASSWGADTAFDPNDWSKNNPARGQCVVSSLIVQDYLGGDLVRYSVSGSGLDEVHYFNRLKSGVYVDTTAGQYTDVAVFRIKPIVSDGSRSIREKRLADEDTANRYFLLSKRVKLYLNSKRSRYLKIV